MNDRRTFASTKALLEAARADAPTRAVRAEIWSGVSDAVGLASASAAAGAAASGAKALALTTLFGGAVTVGVAATLLWFALAVVVFRLGLRRYTSASS